MSVQTVMTALADEVRELSGESGALSLEGMTDKLSESNGTISDQFDLITQIAEALEGKAAGGGGGGDTDIPAGYKRCDFIQFNNGPVVDIGIVGNQDTRIETCFTWESTTQRHLFGCASADNKASITSYMNGSWRFGDKSTSKTVSVKTVPYGVRVDKTCITFAGSNYSISGVSDFETVGTLLLGGARDSDGTLPSVGFYGKCLFYYQWQAGVMVRKWVPVVSSEGVYRFYDHVSKEFFDSATGEPLGGGYFE